MTDHDTKGLNKITSTTNHASEAQNNASAQVKLDDIATAPPNSKSTSDTCEPLSQHDAGNLAAITDRLTGPSVSKKIENTNALIHGIYSKHVVLPWESKEEFDNLHNALRNEWKPNGCSEEQAVFKLAHYTLLECRLIDSLYLQVSNSVPEELKTGKVTWDDMVHHQQLVPKQATGALLATQDYIEKLNEIFELIRDRPYWTDTSDGKKVQMDLLLLQNDVRALIEKSKTSVIRGVQQLVEILDESKKRFGQACQPEEIEKNLDRMAKIDRSKEKILRYLTAIKEYKRTAGLEASSAPVLESPSVVPESSSAKAPTESGNTSTEHHKCGKPKD